MKKVIDLKLKDSVYFVGRVNDKPTLINGTVESIKLFYNRYYENNTDCEVIICFLDKNGHGVYSQFSNYTGKDLLPDIYCSLGDYKAQKISEYNKSIEEHESHIEKLKMEIRNLEEVEVREYSDDVKLYDLSMVTK